MPEPLRVAIVLPRHMRFSRRGATSIDLVAHDLLLFSRHRASSVVVAEWVEEPFPDMPVVSFTRWPWEPHAVLGWRLGHLVKARQPDVVVVHQHLPIASMVARIAAPVPVFLHFHGWPKPPRNAFDRWRRGRRYRRFAGMMVVSDACRDAFVNSWGDLIPLHVVRNALDMAAWQPVLDRDKTIVLAARMSPEKCVLEVAEALAKCLPQLPGWRAVIFAAMVDKFPDYAEAVSRALSPLGEAVDLRFDRPHSEVKAEFERAAIALFPRKGDEPFGRVAIEAFAGGAALVASPGGGLREVIGDAAFPLAAPTPEDIAQAIETLAQDDVLRAEVARKGRERAAGFDIRTAAAAYDGLLEAAAASRPG